MMWRIILTLFFAHLVSGADHNIFKNCSEIDLCSSLRNREPKDVYSVNISSIVVTGEPGLAQMTLTSSDGSDDLLLTLTTLEEDRVRITINEVDKERYTLKEVLEQEPTPIIFDNFQVENTYLNITVGNSNVVVNFDPFRIDFYKNSLLIQVLEGNRLFFTDSGYFTFGILFPAAVQLYGLHEHTDNLALQTTGNIDPYRLKNSDLSGHEMQSPMALYGAIPVLYGHGLGTTSGAFIHNAAEQWIETKNSEDGSEGYFMVRGGSLDVFVLLGPSPQEVVRQYVGLTGTAHLPQLWTLGHHQCRWSYMSQDEVKDVVQNFNNYNFPLDVIWLDIDYTDEKKYFTWNPDTFSDPLELQQNISSSNKKLVTIIDPHIKVEDGYSVYDGAKANGFFVKNPDGSDFEGDCWPGSSSYIDFLNPEARDYYAGFYSYDKFEGSTPTLAGIWNDMNEPSVFDDSLEKTLPIDTVHYGNVTHDIVHNIYGFLHTMSTHEGLIARDNSTKRPFILTRSHFAGTQRYAAIWTGDNEAYWSHLAISYAECLNANILGIVFCGADVGGFGGNPDVELLQRWYQAGAWLPFYRAHSSQGTDHREPYLFDADVQDVIRNAIALRYRHIPTWYTLFYEHTLTRDPVIRPLFYHYPDDPNVIKIDTQLLVGSDILVSAVTEAGVDSVGVYFPGGEEQLWYSLSNGSSEVFTGGASRDIPVDIQSIPVYYRGGSIVTTKEPFRLTTTETIDDNFTIFINFDNNDTATGRLYLDDYSSFEYRDNLRFRYLEITAGVSEQGGLSMTFSDIGTGNSSGFPVVFENIIVNKIEILPTKDEPGKFGQIKLDHDERGRRLREININEENRLFFDLN